MTLELDLRWLLMHLYHREFEQISGLALIS